MGAAAYRGREQDSDYQKWWFADQATTPGPITHSALRSAEYLTMEVPVSFLLLTDALRSDYTKLFVSCEVSRASQIVVDNVVDRITLNRSRYQQVGSSLSVPWYVIGAIHSLEASLGFDRHLHNGDPLTARTTHVPSGRPAEGNPPFTWEESATDALKLDGFDRVADWSTSGTLYELEKYNGFGYRTKHPETLSPYLWGMSSHYTGGKFTSDGLFDPKAVSNQIGGAVILRRMTERQIIQFEDISDSPALSSSEVTIGAFEISVKFAPTEFSNSAKALQLALNQLPGTFVPADGFAGDQTSDAFKRVTGHFLSGDPRSGEAVAA